MSFRWRHSNVSLWVYNFSIAILFCCQSADISIWVIAVKICYNGKWLFSNLHPNPKHGPISLGMDSTNERRHHIVTSLIGWPIPRMIPAMTNLIHWSQFPAQRVSNAENVSIWWRHHVYLCYNQGDMASATTTIHQYHSKNLLSC